MTALDVVSLQEAKEWLRVDSDFTIDDALITSLIESSVSSIEQKISKWMYNREGVIAIYDYSDASDCDSLIPALLLPFPDLKVTGATDSDGNDLPSTDYPILVNGQYEVGENVDSFTFTAGYDVAPDPLKLAVKMLITNDYEDRAIDEKYSDTDIKAKTDPYRRFTWF